MLLSGKNGSKDSVFSGIPVLFQLFNGFMWICGATAISLLWWALELVLVTNNRLCPSHNLPPHSCVLMKWQKFYYASSLLFMLNFQERCHKLVFLNIYCSMCFEGPSLIFWRETDVAELSHPCPIALFPYHFTQDKSILINMIKFHNYVKGLSSWIVQIYY